MNLEDAITEITIVPSLLVSSAAVFGMSRNVRCVTPPPPPKKKKTPAKETTCIMKQKEEGGVWVEVWVGTGLFVYLNYYWPRNLIS